ncbi:MAG: hypothetical protein K2K45_04695 [Muribaculaceae bacterium]|nr:hypothetical protein [Muribaculaceae bacterium]
MEISLKIEKVENRGGARKGAGRKKTENSRNISVACSLSPKAYENLQKLVEKEGSNKNDVINKILENLS